MMYIINYTLHIIGIGYSSLKKNTLTCEAFFLQLLAGRETVA